ncbi:hypothetical protein [uncultured Aquimarina sp.]|uniref:hypothetical protein n=1 Tax=uncultured Aquimarina sp. TaxID=575652 RepID=UPI002637BA77|nr:hypothetical protein [uncultured Aquimarina sp.]
MTKKIIWFVVTSLLVSCAKKRNREIKNTLLSNFVEITENENKGIDEVLDFYQANCEYFIGFSSSNTEDSKKYFKLKMSNSEKLYLLEEELEIPASNIAYRFYKNLENERSNYDEIQTVFITRDGNEESYVFNRETLDFIHKKATLVNTILDSMKLKEYDFLKSTLSTRSYGEHKGRLIKDFKKMDSMYGEISNYSPLGYKVYRTKSDLKILHISGFALRGRQNHALSFYVDFESDKDEILKIQGEL